MPNKNLRLRRNTNLLAGNFIEFYDGTSGPSGTGISNYDTDLDPELKLYEFRWTTNRNAGLGLRPRTKSPVRLKHYERKLVMSKPYFKLDKLKRINQKIRFPSKKAKALWMSQLHDLRRTWSVRRTLLELKRSERLRQNEERKRIASERRLKAEADLLKRFPPDKFDKKFVESGDYYWKKDNRNIRGSKVDLGEWRPEMISRMVSKKPRTRHNPQMPSNLVNNDLTYFKYTVNPFPSSNDMIFLFDSYHALGRDRYFVVGHLPSFNWVTVGGLNRSPFPDLRSLHSSEYRLAQVYNKQVEELSKISLRRLYSRVKNQHIDLATELAQFNQARKLIFESFSRLAKTLLSLKQGKLVKAFKTLFPTSRKQLANDRLAYVYGVKPLVEDIYGATKHLKEFLDGDPFFKVNGHAKTTFEHTDSFDTENMYGKWSQTSVTTKTEIRVKYATRFTIVDPLMRQLTQLGFTNPVNVAWELIPFSFVVDWFLTIGDYVNGLTALKGVKLFEIYRTIYIKETVSIVIDRFPQPASATSLTHNWFRYLTNRFDRWYYEEKVSVFCKREVLPSLPDLPLPNLKNPVSKDHVVNLASLVSQLRK